MELVVQSGTDTGKVFQIGSNPQVAGRQSTADIVLNDNQISRRHAQFELYNGSAIVTDLGSANGTRLNGEVLAPNQPRPLKAGDQIQLGDTVLAVRLGYDAGAATEVLNIPRQVAAATPEPTPAAEDEYVPGQAWQNSPASPPPPAPTANFNPPPAPSMPPANFNPPPPSAANFNPPPAPNMPPANFNPPPGNYNPGMYAPPGAPANPAQAKKGGSPIGWIIGLVVLVLAIGGGVFFLGRDSSPKDSKNSNTPVAGSATTVAAVAGPTATPVRGAAGSNAVPARPVPTTAAARRPNPTATPAPTTANSKGQKVEAIGLTVTFPEDWEIYTDDSKRLVEGSDADNITYVQIQLLAGLKGSGLDRLSAYLNNIKQVQSDIKIVRDVKALSSGNGAEAYITYTDKEDKLLHRDYIIAVPGSGSDTYILRCSTEDAKFDKQVDTFNQILSSIKDS